MKYFFLVVLQFGNRSFMETHGSIVTLNLGHSYQTCRPVAMEKHLRVLARGVQINRPREAHGHEETMKHMKTVPSNRTERFKAATSINQPVSLASESWSKNVIHPSWPVLEPKSSMNSSKFWLKMASCSQILLKKNVRTECSA